MAQRLGDDRWLAHAKICRALASGYAQAPSETDTSEAEEAIRYFRTAGDRWQAANGLQAVSGMQAPEQALQSLNEARRLYAAEGDRLLAANCAFMMASALVRDLGNPAPAQQLARDAVIGRLPRGRATSLAGVTRRHRRHRGRRDRGRHRAE